MHYRNHQAELAVQALVNAHGETVVVQVAGTQEAYRVPRHYIALHGLSAAQLPTLAQRYGWAQA